MTLIDYVQSNEGGGKRLANIEDCIDVANHGLQEYTRNIKERHTAITKIAQ